jgi:hypothetical protein
VGRWVPRRPNTAWGPSLDHAAVRPIDASKKKPAEAGPKLHIMQHDDLCGPFLARLFLYAVRGFFHALFVVAR